MMSRHHRAAPPFRCKGRTSRGESRSLKRRPGPLVCAELCVLQRLPTKQREIGYVLRFPFTK
jgi:hypothetical protein